MIKICLYGPESVGKTSLATELSKEFLGKYVPEVARDMVSTSDFSVSDIIAIGKAQTDAVLKADKGPEKIMFCDTDLITTQIYSKIYLHKIPNILFELEKKVVYDLYFLLDIDVPWVADGLRDLGENRQEIYYIFKNELEKRNIPYTKVKGNWAERKQIVMEKIKQNFQI